MARGPRPKAGPGAQGAQGAQVGCEKAGGCLQNLPIRAGKRSFGHFFGRPGNSFLAREIQFFSTLLSWLRCLFGAIRDAFLHLWNAIHSYIIFKAK